MHIQEPMHAHAEPV